MESVKVVTVKAIEATPSSFKDYGQVIEPTPDNHIFGPHDAQLDLTQGIPRLSIMHLQNCPLKFSSITHHANVTQCLGAAIDSNVWYLAVAKPSVVDSNEIENDSGKTIVKSRSGHFYVPPAIEDVQVFKVSGPKFLKLNRGTWHAGPLFTTDAMNFYNLELTDTNAIDFTTHNFKKHNGVTFSIDE
ncbi:ureidoglycolate hydrolase [Trifolium repens]|nr:ureidoglycolate hydrolase [Trifolium repens]